jgi:peptidoglycan/LPS O-acetylase OafA/YrhL
LLIPQAWSVGLELMFYVLFPFLNRLRNRHLISIIVISVFARFFAYTVLKLDTDPWNYRFFPFEIALFVAGMLVFRVYSSLSWKDNPYPIKNPIIYFITCIVLFSLFIGAKFLFTVSSRYIDANYARFGLYLLWLSVIPVLFHFFKSSDIDRFVGELSYPVYLSHLIMIAFIRMMLGVTGLSDDSLGILSLVVTVLWSIVFYVLLVKRLDEFRYKIIFKQA